jgi:hypothetical protein
LRGDVRAYQGSVQRPFGWGREDGDVGHTSFSMVNVNSLQQCHDCTHPR